MYIVVRFAEEDNLVEPYVYIINIANPERYTYFLPYTSAIGREIKEDMKYPIKYMEPNKPNCQLGEQCILKVTTQLLSETLLYQSIFQLTYSFPQNYDDKHDYN